MTHRHDIIRAADEYAESFGRNPCADACTDARTRLVLAVGLLEAEVRRVRGERDTLRRALLDLMASSDCEWENRNLGHDWRDAMEHAREVLGIHPGGL